jgi:phenylacetate-coenzyme A ligase PaaK-like adenylate-forming protein
MSTQIVFRVLALRHRLREHAYARSPFYGRFHRGLAERSLSKLPILTKEMVMEHFDELVTDPTVRLTDVDAHLANLSVGDELFNGRYTVASTSGSTGRRGLFLWDPGEWAAVLASYNRSFDWAAWGAASPTARGWRW